MRDAFAPLVPYAARVIDKATNSARPPLATRMRRNAHGGQAWKLASLAVIAVAIAGCGSSAPKSTSALSSGVTSSAAAVVEASTATASSAATTRTALATTLSRATSATATATVSPAEAAIPTPGCRHVPRPPTHPGERASKPTETLNPNHRYTVRMQTNCGPIVIELAVREAPETTAAFAHLVQVGFYNDLTFHRIVPGFVIQGGDPAGNGSGGPGWQIVEAPPSNLRYVKGIVAMAKGPTAPAGTSGSQFFIVVGERVSLPPVYALVGHVISGMKSVEAITRVPTEAPPEGGEASRPRVPVVIEKATLTSH